jgi:hypothetical protein
VFDAQCASHGLTDMVGYVGMGESILYGLF